MKKLFMLWMVGLVSTMLFADAGVLIPRDKQQPDPAVLSLEEMEITVRIDNGDARVFVRQIFANHTGADRRRELRLRPSQPRDNFRLRNVGWPRAPACRDPRTQACRGNLQPAQAAGDRSRSPTDGRTRRRRGKAQFQCSALALRRFRPGAQNGWRSSITNQSRSKT